MLRRLIPLLAAAALAACASAPTYMAAPGPNKAGYSETQIESNRYSVVYRAPGGADAHLIDDYALLRAAELTLQSGADWFVVVSRSADASGGYSGPSVGVGVGGGSFGRHSGGGVGLGFNIPLGGGGPQATASRLEIRTGSGPKPDDPNAYDARQVSSSLRARIQSRQ
ncbi:MAG: hypothetical protein ABUL42_02790 [Terricaulis silvestris]